MGVRTTQVTTDISANKTRRDRGRLSLSAIGAKCATDIFLGRGVKGKSIIVPIENAYTYSY